MLRRILTVASALTVAAGVVVGGFLWHHQRQVTRSRSRDAALTRGELRALRHQQALWTLAYAPGDGSLISGSADGELRAWYPDGSCVAAKALKG